MSPDAIALVGPTASGKTAAALRLARHLPIEIISMDSALVYQGMDIGTAKPSAEELAQVPHHLIDIRDPLHAYSAADFERDARQLIQDIQARGKLPLLVGGTMLYFKALNEGLDDLPRADAQVRHAIEEQAQQQGWPALHAQLMQFDPVTAARLAPNDAQRISRALEVWRISGKALSQWFEEAAKQRGASGQQLQMPVVSLEPLDRAWLHERIALRFDTMLAHGFIDEMHKLRNRHDLSPDLPSMRCVGYRQAWEILDEAQATHTPLESLLPRLRELGIAATRQLAKRQLTWLRSMPERHVVACDSAHASEQVVQQIESLIAKAL